ncbi:hypothetical protein [uncultured Gemmobacter sp.]|uniref:hypothetical protein n=1 Tax=uncultured Gemmobacter sp. TaxID=1095917 RepID=UPI00259446BA|nr:hypothetical protein [uncultured Gemmobacter sp.]
MTTKVTVHAHGWPVLVRHLDPNGPGMNIPVRVESGETRDFYVHRAQDLRIHEIQPGEVAGTEAA